MEHLLTAWPEVLKQICKLKQILLFSDFDGTLSPIVEHPEMANISNDTRQLLKSLAEQQQITVGIISGRNLIDLKNKVDIKGIVYAGNHGFEIEGPGLKFISPLAEDIRIYFSKISRLLTLALETTKGVFVENKGLTLSVHYRQMDNKDSHRMKQTLQRIINEHQTSSNFKVTTGKKVVEFRPTINWDKGQAIKLLMERYSNKKKEILPIFLGDDTTDEDGFRTIKTYQNGISVHIGNNLHKTNAKYFLKSTEEVSNFLEILLDYSRESVLK